MAFRTDSSISFLTAGAALAPASSPPILFGATPLLSSLPGPAMDASPRGCNALGLRTSRADRKASTFTRGPWKK